MSWNFRKVGQDKAALKAAVQAEFAPADIIAEVCTRIDGLPISDEKTQAIYVESSGHLDPKPDRPWYFVDDIKIHVWAIPFINTPL